MSLDKNIYKLLSEKNQMIFNQIEDHKLLGAGNHLKVIGDMLIDISECSVQKKIPVDLAINYVLEFANHYIKSRGAASRAVYNGIREMIMDIDNANIQDTLTLQKLIFKNIEMFRYNAAANLENILTYSKNELYPYKSLLLFDYSSTVEKAILSLAEHGEEISLYIAESSAIDGGRPYFMLRERENIKIHFFPDAALYYQMQKCDCVLMGAETFYADGTGFNTIGSDMVGVLCDYLNKPLYFITPLNKLDNRRTKGIRKEIVNIDYKEKYQNASELNNSFYTVIPELIGVNPKHIHAFISEEGVIPSCQMFTVSMAYEQKLGGN